MKKPLVSLVALITILTASVLAQDDRTSTRPIRLPSPMTHNLTPLQQQAIERFLSENPNLRRANPRDAGATDLDGYQPLSYILEGHFNRDFYEDFAVVFTSNTPPLTSRERTLAVDRDWVIVMFHGSEQGSYSHQLIRKERGSCLDGLYYDNSTSSTLWGCGLYTGNFRFKNRGYSVQPYEGENEVTVPEGPPTVSRRGVAANNVSAIRKIDFKNFSYRTEGTLVRLRNGKHTLRERTPGISMVQITETNLITVAYGDITDDGMEDAAIHVQVSGPGNSYYDLGFIYTMRNGRAALLTEFPGGAKFSDPIYEVLIEGGTLVVRHGEDPPNFNGAPCCPSFVRSWIYRWNGSRLMELTRSGLTRYHGK